MVSAAFAVLRLCPPPIGRSFPPPSFPHQGVEVVILQTGDGQRPRIGGMACTWFLLLPLLLDTDAQSQTRLRPTTLGPSSATVPRSALAWFGQSRRSLTACEHSHSGTGVLPLSRRLVLAKRSKAGTRVCLQSEGQSVTLLIITDMVRCITTVTGI